MRTMRTGLVVVLVLLVLSGCGAAAAISSSDALVANGELRPFAPSRVTGRVAITGSSTVYPLTLRMAREFRGAGSR